MKLNLLALCNKEEMLEILKTIEANVYIFLSPWKLSQKEIPCKNQILGKNVFVYAHKALKKGKYFGKIKWNDITPLDGYLVKDMAQCEQETLRMVDRIKRIRNTYDTRRDYYLKNLRYWDYILKKYKINFFYRCAPPHEGYDNIIAHLCRIYGIRAVYSNPFFTNDGLFRYFASDVESVFPDFDYRKDQDNPELLSEIKKYFEMHWNKNKPKIIPPVNPKPAVQKRLLKMNKSIIKFYNSKCVKPDLTKPYIYMPLHYQWEATTCPMGGVFTNQELAVEILSRVGMPVYVKEHPRMSKNRSLEFYQKMLAMPNVKFISTKEDNYSLIDNSMFVATITGTAGFEAMLRGKPVIVFGDIYYMYGPGVWHVACWDNLKNVLENIKNYIPDENKIENFLKTLQTYLFRHNTKSIIQALSKEIIKNDVADELVFEDFPPLDNCTNKEASSLCLHCNECRRFDDD